MKKVLAVVLTLVMLIGAFSFSTSAEDTTTPTVTIITNEGSAVTEGTQTYFTVRFDNFSTIKGVDVTITASAGTLGDVQSFEFKDSAEKNVNYTVDGNTIRFVDLLKNGANNARLVFPATAPAASATINVIGKYAKDGSTLFDITTQPGTFEVKTVVEENPIDQDVSTLPAPSVESKTFIPVGGVYKKVVDGDKTTYTFANKNDNGTFSLGEGGGYTYQSYDIPDNGITTFGISNDVNYPALIRFGSYTNIYDTTSIFGTMLFEGDWLALKNYYIQLGIDVQDFTKILYTNTRTILDKAENAGKTHVIYTVPLNDGGTTKVKVYLFQQSNYMWKNETDGVLEFTIRLHGAKKDVTYTAAAYTVNKNGLVTISHDVKSVKATATDGQ